MTRYTPIDLGTPRPKGRHGGRRPGAPAPGRRGAQRFWRAALMLTAVPELRSLISALQANGIKKHKDEYQRIFAAAVFAAGQDPDLAINQDHGLQTPPGGHLPETGQERAARNARGQSNNQDSAGGSGPRMTPSCTPPFFIARMPTLPVCAVPRPCCLLLVAYAFKRRRYIN